MTPAANLRAFTILAGLMASLTACSDRNRPSTDYVKWCQREFRIARDLNREAQSAIDKERPWISVEEYRFLFGEPPVDGVVYKVTEFGQPVAVQSKTPEHLVELETSTNQTSKKLWSMEARFRPDGDDSIDILSTSALDEHDRESHRRQQLIEAGKTAEDLLPKLEECFEKLPAVTGSCNDSCR